MENSGKICWNLWRVEKSGNKCEKMTIFGFVQNFSIFQTFTKIFFTLFTRFFHSIQNPADFSRIFHFLFYAVKNIVQICPNV